MALGTPSNLSLATLGLISDSIAKTNEVKLDEDCGEGDEEDTAMWASFRIGTGFAVPVTGTLDGTASNRGYFKIRVKGDVGEYMGGTASGEWLSSSLLNAVNFANTYTFYIDETAGKGAYYDSKILSNANNAGDYEGDYVVNNGTDGFPSATIDQQSTKDTFTATGSSGGGGP